MSFTVSLTGMDQVRANFQRVLDDSVRGTENAMQAEMDSLLADSLAIVPRDTNQLADSATATVDTEGNVVTGQVSYNQPDYDYIQHEDLSYNHKPGQQAKFLENPMNEHQIGMDERFAEFLRTSVGL